MKAEQAKKIADQALNQLNEALKQGRSAELTHYLATMAKFHRYSFGNVLMIVCQKPDATHVAGFNTWKQMGRYVKQGEKGIVILAPMSLRVKDEEPKEGEQPKKKLLFRGVFVFDISQTEGQPLPEPAKVSGDPSAHTARLKALIAERGITLDNEDVPRGAEGVSRGGRISIRPDLEPAQEFSVMVHELAHELLHRGEDRKTLSKTVRETEAEAVAFVVSQAIGLNVGTSSSDYISLYDGKAETLAQSLDRIQHTAAAIIAGLECPHEQVQAV
jgi:hypothetical protein